MIKVFNPGLTGNSYVWLSQAFIDDTGDVFFAFQFRDYDYILSQCIDKVFFDRRNYNNLLDYRDNGANFDWGYDPMTL